MDKLKKLKGVKITLVSKWSTEVKQNYDGYDDYVEYVELTLDNGQFILGSTKHGGCPSGWCAATWGDYEIGNEFISPVDAETKYYNITIGDVDQSCSPYDGDGMITVYDDRGIKIFSYSKYCGDSYYPSGFFRLEETMN